MFASCDDKGSTPSGGDTSGLTLTVTLPTRTDYPAEGSAFEVSINSGNASVPASKVAYYAAGEYEGAESAMLVASGFKAPDGGFAAGSTATVTFTNEFGSIFTGTSAAITGILETAAEIKGDSGDNSFKQIPNIAITVSAPEDNYTLVLPESYTVTFAAAGKDPVSIDATATVTPAKPETSAASAAITIKASEALGRLSLGTTYTANIQTVTDSSKYTYADADGASIAFSAGSASLSGEITLAQTWTGAIEVTLPATFTPDGAKDAVAVPSTVSYEVLQGATVVIPGSEAAVAENKFTTAATIPTKASSGASYTINVWFVYTDGIEYLLSGSATGPVSPEQPDETPTAGTAALGEETFEAQVASLTVTLSNGPGAYPANAAQYEISYGLVGQDPTVLEGEAKAAAVRTIASSQNFALSGLLVNEVYYVTVYINAETEIFSHTATMPVATKPGANNLALDLTGTAYSISGSGIEVSNAEADGSITLNLTSSDPSVTYTPSLTTGSPTGSVTIAVTGDKASVTGFIDVPAAVTNFSGLTGIKWEYSSSNPTFAGIELGSIELTVEVADGAVSVTGVTLTAKAG